MSKPTPKFLKLQKFKLRDDRSKVLFGVALHFGILRKEIIVSENRWTFDPSLTRFLDQQLNHYLHCPFQNYIEIADAYGININFWTFYTDPRVCPQNRNPHLTRKIHAKFNYYGAIHFIMKNEEIEHVILDPVAYGLNKVGF